jgi:alpha-D-ribose 1-methylphosphonate 5-phosphate C-P lyase
MPFRAGLRVAQRLRGEKHDVPQLAVIRLQHFADHAAIAVEDQRVFGGVAALHFRADFESIHERDYMRCHYCAIELKWVDARVVQIRKGGEKLVACRDVDACNARRAERERGAGER